MPQITILKSDNSFVEAFFVSEALTNELLNISQAFELDCLTPAFLQEIKIRALSVCSQKIDSTDLATVSNFASANLDWFDDLIALIDAINKLDYPCSLSVFLN